MAPASQLFATPDRTKLAKMLRADLIAACDAWLTEAKADAEEWTRREQSDILADRNEAGEWFDFHSLRRSCRGWLSLTGAHLKIVQSIKRRSTPVLTLNRHGHWWLPGSEAEWAGQLGTMTSLAVATDDVDENFVSMTATDGNGAQRLAQQLGRESRHPGATARDGSGGQGSYADSPTGQRKGKGDNHLTLDDATPSKGVLKRRAWDSLHSILVRYFRTASSVVNPKPLTFCGLPVATR